MIHKRKRNKGKVLCKIRYSDLESLYGVPRYTIQKWKRRAYKGSWDLATIIEILNNIQYMDKRRKENKEPRRP